MSSILKASLNIDAKVLSSAGCDDIPMEVYFNIFEKLDLQSLRCCFAVCRRWKEISTRICEVHGLWQALAEDGIVNQGETHHFKSTLSWKDLYFNSLLWNNLPSAAINKIYDMEKSSIKNMHVYRDKLIVINSISVEYYDIESLQCIRVFSVALCEDLQETDDILMIVYKDDEDYCKVTMAPKADKDEPIDLANRKLLHTFAHSWRWRMVGNCGYVIDSRSVLWKCSAQNKSLAINSLARFYGDFRFSTMSSINSLHVVKGDVYIALMWGDLLVVSEKTRMFRKVNAQEIPTKFVEGHNKGKQPPCREGADKFDAFITVPFGAGFCEEHVPKNLLHFHYDDPEMTCGLQHGDVLFRGFEDGRVEITVLRNNSKVELNIKEFDKGLENIKYDKRPAVLALEVCELKHMHKLFITTEDKLYTLLLTYPKSLLET